MPNCVFKCITRSSNKAGDLVAAKQYDPRKVLAYGVDAIKNTIIEKFTKFNSLNKA